MPKYKAIVKEIEEAIKRGELRPYDQLPTVVELTKTYHVSRTTIEQAMDELEKRGLVSRKRGSGVYVKKVATPTFAKPLNTVSLTDDIDRDLAENPECAVHEFTVLKPDEHVRHELGLHEFSFTFYIVRSHLHQGSPLDMQYLYYPVEIFRDIRLAAAEKICDLGGGVALHVVKVDDLPVLHRQAVHRLQYRALLLVKAGLVLVQLLPAPLPGGRELVLAQVDGHPHEPGLLVGRSLERRTLRQILHQGVLEHILRLVPPVQVGEGQPQNGVPVAAERQSGVLQGLGPVVLLGRTRQPEPQPGQQPSAGWGEHTFHLHSSFHQVYK